MPRLPGSAIFLAGSIAGTIISSIVTVPERKARETERRRQAAAAIIEDLRDFVSAHGGRFYVFGSVAEDRLRYDSDVDILTTAYASPAFVDRVKSCSIVIA